MQEILTQADFDEMILQKKAVLSFYHDWSQYSAVYGIQYFREAENFFRTQKGITEIFFWIANVSDINSPANFLVDWVMNKPNLFNWISTGNPSVIWLKFGEILDCEFSTYILKTEEIVNKTIKYFDL